jgi:ABC-2 type transport system permease protein
MTVVAIGTSGRHAIPSGFQRTWSLTRELAFTQFKLKYTGSVLGYVWSLAKPVMIFAIMYAVFSRLLRGAGTGPHFAFQLLLGIVIWNFFSESISNATNVVASNGGLIKKAFFPRATLVVASSLSAFITFTINILLIVAIATPFGQMELGWRSLAIFPLIFELYLLILGLGMLLSSLFVFYRDIGHIWEVTSQAMFYASAVVFPLSSTFLSTRDRQILALNPVAQIIEDSRHALVTPEALWTVNILPSWTAAIPLLVVLLSVAVGYRVFQRLSPRFAEYL